MADVTAEIKTTMAKMSKMADALGTLHHAPANTPAEYHALIELSRQQTECIVDLMGIIVGNRMEMIDLMKGVAGVR